MAGYGTDDGLSAWMVSNGHVMPSGAPSPAVLRQRGSDYLDGLYGARFTGAPVDPMAQERAWPRVGATAYGNTIPEDTIPTAVINASYAAAWQEAKAPGSLAVVTTPGAQVKRIKVDVIEREYFSGDGDAATNAAPVLTAVEGLLAPFLKKPMEGVGAGIWSVG